MSESKQKEIENAVLKEDVRKCLEEARPIFEKYNIDISAALSYNNNAIVAIPQFVRRPKEPVPEEHEKKT